MKVFFASTYRDGTGELEQLRSIVECLEKNDCIVYAMLYDRDNTEAYEKIFPYDEVVAELEACDIFIGEMSRASQTLGFLLGMSISKTKPSLYLYKNEVKAKGVAPLNDNPSRLLSSVSYSQDSLEDTLRKFLKKAAGQLSSVRTSFMSTKSIDGFLSVQSKKLNIPKGELIRLALEEYQKAQVEL